jgi:hypothetical protein
MGLLTFSCQMIEQYRSVPRSDLRRFSSLMDDRYTVILLRITLHNWKKSDEQADRRLMSSPDNLS